MMFNRIALFFALNVFSVLIVKADDARCITLGVDVANIFLNNIASNPEPINDYIRNAATTQQGAWQWLWNYQPVRDSGCYNQTRYYFWNIVSQAGQSFLQLRQSCLDAATSYAQMFLANLQTTVESGKPVDSYILRAATTQEGANAWLWNLLANSPLVICIKPMQGVFWNAIKDQAAALLAKRPPSK